MTASFSSRLQTINYMTGTLLDDMKREVYEGLTAARKFLPSKYFYDARGSSLFEKICELPEYYQTRTELSILKHEADAIMRDTDGDTIIELGSGANRKIKALLDARNGLHSGLRYVPIDVCRSVLTRAAEELIVLYPDLKVQCIVADFTRRLHSLPFEGNLIVLFGSTIGNFSEAEGGKFMRHIAASMGHGGRFLVGMDMVKPKDILEAAYNDSQGLTAAFNKNILNVMNRELKAHFDPADFDHAAFYDETRERVEMHLRANRDISVRIDALDMRVTMIKGETIHTEVCRKFKRETVERIATDAGLKIRRWFSDARGWFSLVEMMRKN